MERTNEEIIHQISKIINPDYLFDLAPNGSVPTESPDGIKINVENFDVLYFKCKKSTDSNDKKLIEQIKEYVKSCLSGLQPSGFYRVEVCKFQYVGKYILIYLPKYAKRYLSQWIKYQEFKKSHQDQIQKIYEYLNNQKQLDSITEDFIGYELWKENQD